MTKLVDIPDALSTPIRHALNAQCQCDFREPAFGQVLIPIWNRTRPLIWSVNRAVARIQL